MLRALLTACAPHTFPALWRTPSYTRCSLPDLLVLLASVQVELCRVRQAGGRPGGSGRRHPGLGQAGLAAEEPGLDTCQQLAGWGELVIQGGCYVHAYTYTWHTLYSRA